MGRVVMLLLMGIVMAAPAVSAQSAAQKPAAAGHDAHMALGDHEFAHLMAKHHRAGVDMAKLEESGGASEQVKALAAKIRQGQERDLPTLTAHAKAAANAGSMVAAHEKQMEKEHAAMMAKLTSAKGEALDHAFVDEMIKHHQSGLEM